MSIDKIDSETKQQICGDAEFAIFEWDTVLQRYIPTGGYNQYKVERQADVGTMPNRAYYIPASRRSDAFL